MRSLIRLQWSLMVVASLAFGGSLGHAKSLPPDSELPAPVAKTFTTAFPKAVIQKLDVSEEDGVTVYDIEFMDGDTERETDISDDGTLMEVTLVIPADAIPPAPMKTIRAAARGATFGRLERIEISYEIEDGELVKLDTIVTRYAAEMTKKDKMAEVIVAADGKVVERPKWKPMAEKPKAKTSEE